MLHKYLTYIFNTVSRLLMIKMKGITYKFTKSSHQQTTPMWTTCPYWSIRNLKCQCGDSHSFFTNTETYHSISSIQQNSEKVENWEEKKHWNHMECN